MINIFQATKHNTKVGVGIYLLCLRFQKDPCHSLKGMTGLKSRQDEIFKQQDFLSFSVFRSRVVIYFSE